MANIEKEMTDNTVNISNTVNSINKDNTEVEPVEVMAIDSDIESITNDLNKLILVIPKSKYKKKLP